MQNKRMKNVEIFEDSVALMNENENLQRSIEASISKQRLYLEAEEVGVRRKVKSNTKTVVSKKRSFEAAAEYARDGKKVCVLSFASSTNPGGGARLQ